MQKINVVVEGIAPLLMHKFNTEGKIEQQNVALEGKRVVGAPAYIDEAKKSAFIDENGKLYQPSEHFIGAMIKAASAYKIQGRGKKTYKDLIKSSVFIEQEKITHQIQSFDIDARPVVVQRARVIRYRYILNKWKLSFTILNHEDAQLNSSVIKQILEDAGINVGIGDYRPRYGRFVVKEFKVAK